MNFVLWIKRTDPAGTVIAEGFLRPRTAWTSVLASPVEGKAWKTLPDALQAFLWYRAIWARLRHTVDGRISALDLSAGTLSLDADAAALCDAQALRPAGDGAAANGRESGGVSVTTPKKSEIPDSDCADDALFAGLTGRASAYFRHAD